MSSTSASPDYYDAHIDGKLAGFLKGNVRVEHAARRIEQYAPRSPRRILEIGCGIGDVSWRMDRHFTPERIDGVDTSPASIDVAALLFGSERLRFHCGMTHDLDLPGDYDLIVLMDVYEHIPKAGRPEFHTELRRLLSPRGRIILTCPTPRKQADLRANNPAGLQPVDEDVSLQDLLQLSIDLQVPILCYEEIDVWNAGDYAHAVLGNRDEWNAPRPRSLERARRDRIADLLRRDQILSSLLPAQRLRHFREKTGADSIEQFLAGRSKA